MDENRLIKRKKESNTPLLARFLDHKEELSTKVSDLRGEEPPRKRPRDELDLP